MNALDRYVGWISQLGAPLLSVSTQRNVLCKGFRLYPGLQLAGRLRNGLITVRAARRHAAPGACVTAVCAAQHAFAPRCSRTRLRTDTAKHSGNQALRHPQSAQIHTSLQQATPPFTPTGIAAAHAVAGVPQQHTLLPQPANSRVSNAQANALQGGASRATLQLLHI